MTKYVLKRIALAFMTAVIILSLTFILIKLLPFEQPVGLDPQKFAYYQDQVRLGFVQSFNKAQTSKGDPLWSYASNGQQYYYYQVPVFQQFFSWLRNILTRWDWGTSVKIQANVAATVIIGERIKVSMLLNILSVVFSVPIGIALGIWAALKKNTITDHIISTLIMVFISVPSFVLITFLMLWLCYGAKVLPTQWPSASAPFDIRLKAFILPVFCLSFGSICGYCRFTRAELCEVMESDYLLLARTKGLTKRQAILRHALRNAMVPIFPMIMGQFIGILGGSLIVENFFSIPGVGQMYIKSINVRDYNFFMFLSMFYVAIGLVASLLVDLSYGIVDPRIRIGAKK